MRFFFAAIVMFSLQACTSSQTIWNVRTSEGLDAILFVGALSGDKLQAEQYASEIKKYSAPLNNAEHAALGRIGKHFAKPGNGLAGPFFSYYSAASPDQSYEGIGAILADPTPFITGLGDALNADELKLFRDYNLVYKALDRIGFVNNWRENIEPMIAGKVREFEDVLSPYDIIPLQEKYLGRDLENQIEVILLHYNKPYGIRVVGQRFATFHGWDSDTTLRTANT